MAEGVNCCRLEAKGKQQELTRLSPPHRAVRAGDRIHWLGSLWAGWDLPARTRGPRPGCLFAKLWWRGAGGEQGSGSEPRVGRGGGQARSGLAFGDVLGAVPCARLSNWSGGCCWERRGLSSAPALLDSAEFPPPRGQRPGTARPRWPTSPAGSAGPRWPEPQECWSSGPAPPALLGFSSFKNIL